MDDSIKDRLQGIIDRRDADGQGSAIEREASAQKREGVFLALWSERLEEVIRPAFDEFGKHLSTTYKIASHITRDEPVGAFKPRGDPSIRFVFADPPMLGQRSEASFFEIRCDPRTQSWMTQVEVRDGQRLNAKSERSPLPLDEIGAEWIHERLAQVLAESYGQRANDEESPEEEDPAPEDPEPESPEQSAAALDREETASDEPASEEAERPDAEDRDSDAQKSPDE